MMVIFNAADFERPMPDGVYEELARRAAKVSAQTTLTVAEARELFRSLRAASPGKPPTEEEVHQALRRRRTR